MISHLTSTVEGQEIIRAQGMAALCLRQHGGHKDNVSAVRLTYSSLNCWFSNTCALSVAVFTLVATVFCVVTSTGKIIKLILLAPGLNLCPPGSPGPKPYRPSKLIRFMAQ